MSVVDRGKFLVNGCHRQELCIRKEIKVGDKIFYQDTNNSTEVTWQLQMSKMAVGVDAKLYLTDGNRKDDVAFSGSVGFPSTAPMLTEAPDKHKEIWAELTAFVLF